MVELLWQNPQITWSTGLRSRLLGGHSSGLTKSEVSANTVGWGTVLLDGEEVTRDRMNGWWQLEMQICNSSLKKNENKLVGDVVCSLLIICDAVQFQSTCQS